MRKSEVWKHFLLDKVKEVAKCKLCDDKNITKVLKVKGGNTKSLLDHIQMIHKKPSIKPGKGQIDNFFGRKSLGETIAKLAIGKPIVDLILYSGL